MIKAKEAREIVLEVKENEKQEKITKAKEFCESLNDSIKKLAQDKKTYLGVKDFDNSIIDFIIIELSNNGFNAWVDVFGKLIVQW